jgi:hypothetical protein
MRRLICWWRGHKWKWIWTCLVGTLPTMEYGTRICVRCEEMHAGPTREQKWPPEPNPA